MKQLPEGKLPRCPNCEHEIEEFAEKEISGGFVSVLHAICCPCCFVVLGITKVNYF